MRIAFRVGPFPELSETFVINQIRGLMDHGHRVGVLADSVGSLAGHPDMNWTSDLLEVKYAKTWVSRHYSKLPYRLRIRRERWLDQRLLQNYDVVLSHFGWFGARMASYPAPNNGAFTATVFHGADLSKSLQSDRPIDYEELLSKSDLLLPISDYWRQRLLEMGAAPDKVLVHHMGIDSSLFSLTERRSDANTAVNFVSVCRLVEKKGIEYALRAIARLREQMPALDVRYNIVGDGPLMNELQQLSADLGLREVSVFHGEQSNRAVAELLRDATGFVLPSVTASDSDMEGIPVALMEAMAGGIPVVSTWHSGIPELVVHEKTGLLAKERDVDDLADCLARLITDDAATSRRITAARALVEDQFDQAKLCKRLSEELKRLTGLE